MKPWGIGESQILTPVGGFSRKRGLLHLIQSDRGYPRARLAQKGRKLVHRPRLVNADSMSNAAAFIPEDAFLKRLTVKRGLKLGLEWVSI